MNIFKKAYCRIYQSLFYLASYFLDFSIPVVFENEHASYKIADLLLKKGYKHPLIVTDATIFKLSLLDEMVYGLKEANISYSIYRDVVPNPTIKNIEEAYSLYLKNKCDCIIGFGGGSSIDAAKGVGARVANPKKSIEKMKGVLKVKRKIPFFIAVPTTAGTGSETTLASVVVNENTHDKYAINDPKLIPDVAVLDPCLLIGLPKSVTATTGMDALTHAIEAYIGRSNTKKTKKSAIEAIKLIDQNILESYNNGENLEARKAMQKASFLAGVAFTRAYVGYVHAIAHSLGGRYNVPHGLANAVILPHVLEAFGSKATKRLAELSSVLNLTSIEASDSEKAKAFIDRIRELNEAMNIPTKLDIDYNKDDLFALAKHADKEANPLYPVPKEMDAKELFAIYHQILK